MYGLFILFGVIGLIVIALILWAILTYNGFVKSHLLVDNNFSQIKIQCKKRFDLIPNLVEVVKGYAQHEKDTLENVVKARNMGASANSPEALAEANNMLSQTLGRLFALSESYPELKANAGFTNLQHELVNLEKAIAVSRQFYNDSVMIYNRKIMVFPNSALAGVFRFNKAEFFDASEEELQNVKVSF